MRKITQTPQTMRALLFCALSYFYSAPKAEAQCDSIGYYPKGGKIEMNGFYYLNSYSYWFYTQYCNFSNGLSHSNIVSNATCVKTARGGSWANNFDTTLNNTIKVGQDGSYKPTYKYVIKSEQSAGKKDTVRFWFAIKGHFAVESVMAMVKYSTIFDSAMVCGPSSNCSLPVHMLNLFTITKDNAVTVSWATASEVNNNYFDVQKSLDGENWKSIGKVKSQSSTGHSNIDLYYEHIDYEPLKNKKTFYRIVQHDFNGEYEIFGPIANTYYSLQQNEIKVYPNPSNGQKVSFELLGGYSMQSVEFEISNSIGEVLEDYSNLTPGIYFARVKNDRQNTPPKSFMVK